MPAATRSRRPMPRVASSYRSDRPHRARSMVDAATMRAGPAARPAAARTADAGPRAADQHDARERAASRARAPSPAAPAHRPSVAESRERQRQRSLGRRARAACLSSGWRECGSSAGEVSVLTPALSRAAEEALAPVHRQVRLARAHRSSASTSTYDARRGATRRAPGRRRRGRAAPCRRRSSPARGSGDVPKRLRHGAGAAHAVPLVAQAPGGEAQRIARVDASRRRGT